MFRSHPNVLTRRSPAGSGRDRTPRIVDEFSRPASAVASIPVGLETKCRMGCRHSARSRAGIGRCLDSSSVDRSMRGARRMRCPVPSCPWDAPRHRLFPCLGLRSSTRACGARRQSTETPFRRASPCAITKEPAMFDVNVRHQPAQRYTSRSKNVGTDELSPFIRGTIDELSSEGADGPPFASSMARLTRRTIAWSRSAYPALMASERSQRERSPGPPSMTTAQCSQKSLVPSMRSDGGRRSTTARSPAPRARSISIRRTSQPTGRSSGLSNDPMKWLAKKLFRAQPSKRLTQSGRVSTIDLDAQPDEQLRSRRKTMPLARLTAGLASLVKLARLDWRSVYTLSSPSINESPSDVRE
jgi:hypothetical protein